LYQNLFSLILPEFKLHGKRVGTPTAANSGMTRYFSRAAAFNVGQRVLPTQTSRSGLGKADVPTSELTGWRGFIAPVRVE
jgi:hypothetical protein